MRCVRLRRSTALREAVSAGVEVLAYGAAISAQDVRLIKRLDVLL